MSETLIGIFIGSGLSLAGSLITIIANYLLEHSKNRYKEKDYLAKRREDVYLRIFKLYAKYSVNESKEELLKEILDATYEVYIYGSKNISQIIDSIDPNGDKFDLQLENLRSELRKELGIKS